ncbi:MULTISPECIES: response regulator transcription factor [Blautia]|uniref:response regulator transcription factor n=1 Tax=Blautia TaxID=572511 RepID=UPI000BA31D15|nr:MULTISPECIES: response regulator transcription factor [Blautia]
MKETYKILIVDDEPSILDMLKLQLESEGYVVYTAINAKEALDKLSNCPDIILLDINMSGMNGLDLCVSIRDFVSCPILFLTARVSEQDKINGLMAGGDDYITKPFSMSELLARLSAHLRRENRSHKKTKNKFSEELIIDYSDRSLYIKNNRIELSNKEFEIIQLLSANAGQVFDREKIYEIIWGFDSNGDSTVIKEHIRKIRSKFSEYTEKAYISTVWGVGYKWIK